MNRFSFGAGAVLCVLLAAGTVRAAHADLRVSSVGFRPTDVKRVSSVAAGETFEVVRTSDGEIVFSGEVEPGKPKTEQGYPVPTYLFDFSEVTEPGNYYVRVHGVGRTIRFPISDAVYDDTVMMGMLGLYGLRANQDVEFVHQGQRFFHEKGHLEDGLLDQVGQPGESRDGLGGWYDAGDFGKYTVNSAFSVGSLLSAWEQFPETLGGLEMPVYPAESELPHYLIELKFQIDWMLKMQIREGDLAGATYHKLTPLSFAEKVLPKDDPSPRYFSPHGSTSTAAFAAVMAQASRVFSPYDENYAAELLEAAELAWQWLLDNPDYLEADISAFATGTYQSSDEDERFWAAVELWETTGQQDYLSALEDLMGETFVARSFDWDHMANFGFSTYLRSRRDGRTKDLVERAREDVLEMADNARAASNNSPWGRAEGGYSWGSNGRTLRQCMTVMLAHELSEDSSYIDICTQQLGYVYGRNPYNRSQVTGHGIDPPQFPHHRISASDDVAPPYPGLLVGGGTAPGNWSDRYDDFQTNEVAINWNAALVYAAAALSSGELSYRQKKGGTGRAINGPPPAPPPPLVDLIDDLEDGDRAILPRRGRNGAWYTRSDGTGTDPELSWPTDSGKGELAVAARGEGYSFWGAALGLTFIQQDGKPISLNARDYSGLRFFIKTESDEPRRVRVAVRDAFTDEAGGTCDVCNDYFRVTIEATEEWTEHYVPFARLGQAGYGDKQPALSQNYLYGVEFQTYSGDPLDISIDHIGFASTNPDVVAAEGGGDENLGGAGGVPSMAGAGGEESGEESGAGCGCRIQNRDGPSWGAALLLGSLVLARRRRQMSNI